MRRFTRWTAAGLLAVGVVAGAASGWGRSQPPTPSAVLEPAVPGQAPAVVVRPAGAADVPRQEAAVGLVWSAPAEARVGTAARYTLTATNTCNQLVQKVTVQVRVPDNVVAAGCTPAPREIDGVLLWPLGDLRPNQARTLTMDFTPSARGPLTAEAWVTFTGTAAATVAVKEPRIEVTGYAPKDMPLGGTIGFRYVIKNTGDVPVTGIRFEQRHLSPPPQAELKAEPAPAPAPSPVALEPGEAFTVLEQLPATGRGEMHVGFDVTADGGLAATTSSRTKVLAPRLAVAVTGPPEVGLTKAATYTVTVTNSGDLPAEFVSLTCDAGSGLTFAAAPVERVFDALAPGESKEFQMTGAANRPGDLLLKARATEQLPQGCPRPAAAAGGECKTVVRGVPGIRMEVADGADPVRVNGETVYEIKVTNTGTEADRNLRLTCDLPAGAELLSATGPTAHLERAGTQRTVTFEPVRELGPRTEVVFRVRVKATAIGDARFRAAIASDHLATPVVREESTTVYGN